METIEDSAEKENFLSFQDLIPPLDPKIISILEKKLKFDKITKVQYHCIPLFEKKDICVKSCTGSGKTLAYVIPVLSLILKKWKKYLSLKQPEKEGEKTTEESNENQTFEDDIAWKRNIIALILVPSRELAIQVYKTIKCFSESLTFIRPNLFIGGNSVQKNINTYEEKGGNVIIGTLGRIYDVIQRTILDFSSLNMLILDEADKLLESQFDNKLYLILPHLQKERRTGLFSSTMSSELEGLLKVGLKDPIHIQIELQTKTRNHTSCIFATLDSTSQFDPFSQNAHKHLQTKFCSQSTNMISEIPSTLENYYFTVNSCREKLPFLISFAENHNDCKILVFLPTCASVEFFYNLLIFYLKNHSSLTAITEKSNLNTQKSSRIMEVLKMHGKLTQKKRNKIYNQFLTLQSGLLLTTDLLARGIDIQGVHWIFQFDPPQYSQSFLHRIGRTARAGNCGNSLILLLKNESAYVEFLKLKKIELREFVEEWEVGELGISVKEILKTDRALVDKSMAGFISYIRYYKEHELSYLFPFKELPLAQLASAFGLFTLPKIKELRGVVVKDFEEDKIDIESIKYSVKNQGIQKEESKKKREEKRKEKLAEKGQSVKKMKKFKDTKKHLKISTRKRKRRELDMKEWDEIAAEERLFKKLKKGKITQEEFDQACSYDNL